MKGNIESVTRLWKPSSVLLSVLNTYFVAYLMPVDLYVLGQNKFCGKCTHEY